MYYDNHVTVLPKKNSHIGNGKNKEWDCFLCGEFFGSISFL